jgi:hypothetical protein
VTIRTGESIVAAAGQAYGICEAAPARQYEWDVSDERIVTATVLDSMHARIAGVRAGQATVTPRYRSNGRSLTLVTVVVIPQ